MPSSTSPSNPYGSKAGQQLQKTKRQAAKQQHPKAEPIMSKPRGLRGLEVQPLLVLPGEGCARRAEGAAHAFVGFLRVLQEHGVLADLEKHGELV